MKERPASTSGGVLVPLLLLLVVGLAVAGGWWFMHRPAGGMAAGDGPQVAPPSEPVQASDAIGRAVAPGVEPVRLTPSVIPETPASGRLPRQRLAATHSELLVWVKEIETISDEEAKKTAFLELGKELGAEQLENALSLVGGVSDPVIRNWLFQGLFEVQALADPARALRAALGLNPDLPGKAGSVRKSDERHDFETALLAVLKSWATVDPAAAVAYLDHVPERLQSDALVAVYETWAVRQPEKALAASAELPDGAKASVLEAIFKGWAQQDPVGAAASATAVADDVLRLRLFKGIAAGFLVYASTQNPREIADWAAQVFPDDLLGLVMPTLYTHWSRTDPRAAAEYVRAREGGQSLNGASPLVAVLLQWSKADMAQAVTWLDRTFTDDETYMQAVTLLAARLRYEDPARAADLLEAVPFTYADGTAGADEVARLLGFWSRKDPAAAVKWVEAVGDRALRVVATKAMAANWASRDYNQALTWSQGLADPDMKAYALSNVAMRQALHGMTRSNDWIRELPAGFIRSRTAAGFALGVLWRVKDDTSAALIKEQLSRDELDMAGIQRIVDASSLDAESKTHLLSLLQ